MLVSGMRFHFLIWRVLHVLDLYLFWFYRKELSGVIDRRIITTKFNIQHTNLSNFLLSDLKLFRWSLIIVLRYFLTTCNHIHARTKLFLRPHVFALLKRVVKMLVLFVIVGFVKVVWLRCILKFWFRFL